jgi:hypothetical protein
MNDIEKLTKLYSENPERIKIIETGIKISEMSYFEGVRVAMLKDLPTIQNSRIDFLIEKLNCIKDITPKKAILVQIALHGSIDSYRFLEKYIDRCPKEIQNFTYLCLLSAQRLIENILMESEEDDSKIYVLTGLGGKKNKLRYFLQFFLNKKNINIEAFTYFHKEFIAYLSNENIDIEIENSNYRENTVCFMILLSLEFDIQNVIINFRDYINDTGIFFIEDIYITNEHNKAKRQTTK